MHVIDLTVDHQLVKSEKLACCSCGKMLDGATGDKNVPKDGDITICVYCAEVMLYKGQGSRVELVPIPPEDIEDVRINFPDSYKALMFMVDSIKRIII